MDDERWYLVNIIFLSGSSWIRKFQDAGIMDRKLLCCHSTTTVIPIEINPISKWFAVTGFSVLCRELVLCATSSGNGVEIVCGRDAL